MEIVKNIDKAGRIVIPSEWRKGWGNKVLLVRISEDEVLIRAIKKKMKLTDLIDSIEVEVDDFTDTHKLREAIHG
ncbi:MAG: hypothetical protein NDF54_04135 [archaeon GB-1867-035]|nr:hypothetical protein [Candidatus Culexmicrobium profundum]